jgi:hypothetical protein
MEEDEEQFSTDSSNERHNAEDDPNEEHEQKNTAILHNRMLDQSSLGSIPKGM